MKYRLTHNYFRNGNARYRVIPIIDGACALWLVLDTALGYYSFAQDSSTLTLRCKAIRGRILGVGAGWLGFGGRWLFGRVRIGLSNSV